MHRGSRVCLGREQRCSEVVDLSQHKYGCRAPWLGELGRQCAQVMQKMLEVLPPQLKADLAAELKDDVRPGDLASLPFERAGRWWTVSMT